MVVRAERMARDSGFASRWEPMGSIFRKACEYLVSARGRFWVWWKVSALFLCFLAVWMVAARGEDIG